MKVRIIKPITVRQIKTKLVNGQYVFDDKYVDLKPDKRFSDIASQTQSAIDKTIDLQFTNGSSLIGIPADAIEYSGINPDRYDNKKCGGCSAKG